VSSKKFIAGAASAVINCAVGDGLAGQLHKRVCRGIRDDLEANLLYLSDGERGLVFASCDLVDLETPFVADAAARIAKAARVPAGDVLIACTHTHAGPTTYSYIASDPVNEGYLEELKEKLAAAARAAVASAVPARLGWGLGRAHIGFNRRLCWADGTHTMYGDTWKPGFTGLEGPDDPSHAVLFATDESGKTLCVVHNNTCHATCLESVEVASADFPGEARRLIRESLGWKAPVLYLQGAAGDTSPWDLLKGPGRDGEPRLREIGKILAEETLRLMKSAKTVPDAVLRPISEVLRVKRRVPSAAEVAEAKRVMAEGEGSMEEYDKLFRYQIKSSIVRLAEEDRKSDTEEMTISSFRIGDLAVTANPTELYCRFGLDIKRRSPAPLTMVVELANGYSGYCPTYEGCMGGGYSGETSLWNRLELSAGYRLVDIAVSQIHELWK